MGILEEIDLAYENQGLYPCSGKYFIEMPNANHVCPLTILAIQAGVASTYRINTLPFEVYNWAAKRFGEYWTKGFMTGYDGKNSSCSNPSYNFGYLVGKYIKNQHLGVAA